MDVALRELQRLAQKVDSEPLAALILDRLAHTVPEFFIEDDVAFDMAAAVRANVNRLAQLVTRGEASEALPVEASDLLQSTIQHGIPLISLLEAYRAAQSLATAWWQGELEKQAPKEIATRAARKLHELLVAYIDAAVADIRSSYEAERRSFEHSADIRRAHVIRRLLAGESLDPEAAARTLNHPLTVGHIAIVLWRTDEDAPDDGFDVTIAALAVAAGRVRVLRLPAARHRTYAWLSASGPLDVDRVGAIRIPDGIGGAMSGVHRGLDGFVQAHGDAVRAAGIARATGRHPEGRMTSYEGLELVALLSRDPTDRDRFIRRVLGPLADDSVQARRTRETLVAYYRAGSSASGAAARLGVHRNTVMNRLNAAGGLVVEHDDPRRLELEVALHLDAETGWGRP